MVADLVLRWSLCIFFYLSVFLFLLTRVHKLITLPLNCFYPTLILNHDLFFCAGTGSAKFTHMLLRTVQGPLPLQVVYGGSGGIENSGFAFMCCVMLI